MDIATELLNRLHVFEDEPSVIYAVRRDLRLLYCNAAWDRFALENGGHSVLRHLQVGVDLASVLPGPVRAFYLAALEKVWISGVGWDHDYECSSPDRCRVFHMRVHPLTPAAPDTPLIIVNSLADERRYPGLAVNDVPARFQDASQ